LVIFAGEILASEKSLVRHYHKHPVHVRPADSTSGVLKDVRLKHEESAPDAFYLHITGTVTKPWRKDRSRAVIVASFIDKEGNIVAEEDTEVLIGEDSPKEKQESFSIKVQDDPKIVQCILNVEWLERSST